MIDDSVVERNIEQISRSHGGDVAPLPPVGLWDEVASVADVEMGIEDVVEVAEEGCGEFVGAVSIRRGAQTQPNSLPPMYRLGCSRVTEELLDGYVESGLLNASL